MKISSPTRTSIPTLTTNRCLQPSASKNPEDVPPHGTGTGMGQALDFQGWIVSFNLLWCAGVRSSRPSIRHSCGYVLWKEGSRNTRYSPDPCDTTLISTD
ncbi:hypothetical protein KIL84_005635 [Mauremys mutica]|uniref:Uncharacterized protein n=1 Tax=Mauremys mutica TaxID=74926 RepID=A0A9D3XIB2_9SAUR|nr:hypothetical protein KIL84_005635 [Mauremys mutica]